MKKILVLLIFLLSMQLGSSLSCFNSLDDFASQVILNKKDIDYNLSPLNDATNIAKNANTYIFQSHYDTNLAAIISEENFCEQAACSKYLSIRLQTPTKYSFRTVSHTLFTSSSVTGKINFTSDSFNQSGWEISCDKQENPQQCEFKNSDIDIFANQLSQKNKYELLIDITEQSIVSCSDCTGKCLFTSAGSFCITSEKKKDLEYLLKSVGLIKNFNELFNEYRVFQNGQKTLNDLSPEVDMKIDWNQAMKSELVWLRKQNILHITDSDIEAISKLSFEGKSGQNSMIVYSKDDTSWKYYSDTKFPDTTKIKNCQPFPILSIPQKSVEFPALGISLYYLMPIIFISIFVIILIIAIVIGRISAIREKRESRGKKGQ